MTGKSLTCKITPQGETGGIKARAELQYSWQSLLHWHEKNPHRFHNFVGTISFPLSTRDTDGLYVHSDMTEHMTYDKTALDLAETQGRPKEENGGGEKLSGCKEGGYNCLLGA